MTDSVNTKFSKEIQDGVLSVVTSATPTSCKSMKFNKIICHNVLECIDNKLEFINQFDDLLSQDGIFLLSHHDFDSAIYNTGHKQLTRDLIHCFADTQQAWQEHSDGQMGRKIPGLINKSVFRNTATCETMRIVETEFQSGNYGYLMADMITSAIQDHFDHEKISTWRSNLEALHKSGEYFFAIDLVVAIIQK